MLKNKVIIIIVIVIIIIINSNIITIIININIITIIINIIIFITVIMLPGNVLISIMIFFPKNEKSQEMNIPYSKKAIDWYLIFHFKFEVEKRWEDMKQLPRLQKRIPGVGFEPTRTTRPLDLKSNALTTRPSWSRSTKSACLVFIA